jgi:hypothetical protein
LRAGADETEQKLLKKFFQTAAQAAAAIKKEK